MIFRSSLRNLTSGILLELAKVRTASRKPFPMFPITVGDGIAPDLAAIADEVVERIRVDAEFASLVAEQLGVPGGAALRTVREIIDNDEDFAVEFKSTARWDLREDRPNKLVEDAVVKTVAGFLNTDGGTLLIGVGPDRRVVGLGYDYQRVKPPNGDGFVNWLTTQLTNALGHAAVMRTRARITVHDGQELCRLDVARSSRPVWARTSKEDRVFFVRMNNSTRALPARGGVACLPRRSVAECCRRRSLRSLVGFALAVSSHRAANPARPGHRAVRGQVENHSPRVVRTSSR